jgi:hypothetical protein
MAEYDVAHAQALQNPGAVDLVDGRNPRTLQRHVSHRSPPRR